MLSMARLTWRRARAPRVLAPSPSAELPAVALFWRTWRRGSPGVGEPQHGARARAVVQLSPAAWVRWAPALRSCALPACRPGAPPPWRGVERAWRPAAHLRAAWGRSMLAER